jgi:hypothetical protein
MESRTWAAKTRHHEQSSGFTTILPTGTAQNSNKSFLFNRLSLAELVHAMHSKILIFGYRFWRLSGVKVESTDEDKQDNYFNFVCIGVLSFKCILSFR